MGAPGFRPRLADIAVFTVVIALGVLVFASGFSPQGQGLMLEVEANGKRYLYRLDQDLRLDFPGPAGLSTVEIHDHQAAFVEAPCPDKLCIHQGRLKTANAWAACLPNRVIIRIVGSTSIEDEGPDILGY